MYKTVLINDNLNLIRRIPQFFVVPRRKYFYDLNGPFRVKEGNECEINPNALK